MMTVASIALLMVAAISYCISQLWTFGKLKWSKADTSFWGTFSDQRKYKNEKAPTTYYYKIFNLSKLERFPGSATIFVALTDGYHLMQFVFLLCVCTAIGIHYDRWIITTLILRIMFGVSFSLVYKLLGR